MRPALWTALAALVAGLGLASAGRATGARALDVLGGLALLAAAGTLLTLLPWRTWFPLEPMPGLFPPVGEGRRWCEACGSVADPGACAACGDDPRAAGPGRRQDREDGRPAPPSRSASRTQVAAAKRRTAPKSPAATESDGPAGAARGPARRRE